ncbi:MAG: ABC-2 family transporter protein, partial [Chthoniobacteraceae bacterium]
MTLNSQPSTDFFLKYWKLFDIGLQNTFVYRWNFLLRTIFGIVPLAGMIFIWRAVFDVSGKPISGYNYSSMIYYFMVTVFLDNLITPTEDEWQIAGEIRDGKISAYLIKPMNYLLYRITAYLSYRLLYIAVVFIPVCILGFVFREHIALPEHASTWPVLALSTLMAAGIQFFIAYATAMLAFWILEISTVVFILYSFEYFLSGHVFPLDIMPAWMQGFIQWSPFAYELYFPAQIAMERIRGA